MALKIFWLVVALVAGLIGWAWTGNPQMLVAVVPALLGFLDRTEM